MLKYTLVKGGRFMSDDFLKELENDELVDLLLTLEEIEEDLNEKEVEIDE
jgi:hypothetical protein